MINEPSSPLRASVFGSLLETLSRGGGLSIMGLGYPCEASCGCGGTLLEGYRDTCI